MELIPFTHLHVHSQYSILDGQASVQALVEKAVKDGMTSVALTDHGNMLGIKEFFNVCKKSNIKPILGCETYMARRTLYDKVEKNDLSGWHFVLLAKNITGYRNLIHLVSVANIEGFYNRPRIDKDLLEKYHDGLIALTACLGGEIPKKIINNDIQGAEDAIIWYKNLFGEDFYLELQRLPSNDPQMYTDVYEKQIVVNSKILELSKKYDIKVVATNDVHFTDENMAEAHDILLCISTGKNFDDEKRLRYTKQEWFKTTKEMNALFEDIPEALANTQEIVDKIESYSINSDIIMPEFPIPNDFKSINEYKQKFPEEDLRNEFGDQYKEFEGSYEHYLQIKLELDYLEYLTIKGAEKLYGNPIPDEIKERIDFELETIKSMGFPSYFLIIQDLINEARKMGVLVGPGRGSAAGSVVAYCIGITLIDPIKHELLFERFLNPERISMPDVDIDFDDDRRQLVFEYVANKYGHEKVAHICTFGTMAAKSSIKDVGRVLRLPLSETDRLSKLIPEGPTVRLDNAYSEVLKLELETGNIEETIEAIEKKRVARSKKKDDDLDKDILRLRVQSIFAEEIRDARKNGNEILLKTLELACLLEGSIRQTGVHACGVLIGRDSLDRHIPLLLPKEGFALKLVTQYEGTLVESIGLLKMDFLGLKTLSIIRETLEAIKLSKGIDIDIEEIPDYDMKSFEIFSKGETTGIFQFESPGMRKNLRMLRPNRFEDLVAMNALYRPGPMDYIEDFIDRKLGRKIVEYDHPLMEPYLKDTYGITVYQEQVMLLSRALGQFTRGESDTLRKAMGKKDIYQMMKLEDKFRDGCKNNEKFMTGCVEISKDPDKIIDKIWGDWKSFAKYAFNKSHAVCYARLALQTAYLKAHYPAEFMIGLLSCNISDIKQISIFMEECSRMNIKVLGPDINESNLKFSVNKNGSLRFGMAAIKGVGEGVVEEIIKERKKGGVFTDIYNIIERVNLQSLNKKGLEALAGAGAFDSFGKIHRAQYFASSPNDDETTIEKLIRYGNKFQADKESMHNSLFGSMTKEIEIKKPDIPDCLPFSSIDKLEREKELVGMYLSAHPLDDFKIELKYYCNHKLKEFSDLQSIKGREFRIGGMVKSIRTAQTREKGNPCAFFVMEDYSGFFEFALFGNDYSKYFSYLRQGLFLLIKGKVQSRKNDPSRLEIRELNISPLGETLENNIKKATLAIPIQELTEEMVTELSDITSKSKGKIMLHFIITDNENERHRIKLFSRSLKVNLTSDFVKFFDVHPEIELNLS